MASSPPISIGALTPWSHQGDYNTQLFAIRQAISKLQTATLVQVKACTNNGGVSPFGLVDVVPLVNQVDALGNPTPHITVFGLPYLRIQGGSNAIIIDPQPGDVGVAVFASRDISKVKSTQAQANPGSARQYSFEDGMYLGGLLNAAPSQYLQFNSGGITVLSPNAVTLTAPAVHMGASGGTVQPLATQALVTWVNNTLLPALAAHNIIVAAPPANSLTTATEAS